MTIVVSDFRSASGCFAVGSLVVLPIWLFALHKGLLVYQIPLLVQHSITLALIVGRSFCVFVEVCASFLTIFYYLVLLVRLSLLSVFMSYFRLKVYGHHIFMVTSSVGYFPENFLTDNVLLEGNEFPSSSTLSVKFIPEYHVNNIGNS